jgi:FixJ family two-component response regulator
MSEREILLADSDSEVREQMADSFREAGYDVETTDSTVHLFCTVLEKQIPVVLLGSGCDKKIALPDLVSLLKKCNRHVTIILVSDDESLPVVRNLRQEGIFYHALKPESRNDTEEILAAVECAFNKPAADCNISHAPKLASREEAEVNRAAAQCVASQAVTAHATNTTLESRHGEEKTMKALKTAIIVILTMAVTGLVYCASAATNGGEGNSDLVIWGFLGFCALIVVGQLLPAVVSFMAAKKEAARRLQEELAVSEEKRQVAAVFDKSE